MGKHYNIGEKNGMYGVHIPKEKHNWYGRKHTEETKLKMSESRKKYVGEKCPMYGRFREQSSNWQGGISFEDYCEIWKDLEYKQSIRDRDKNQCRNCGLTRQLSFKVYNRNLQVHHIDYNKKNCSPDNLITLCISCNIRANTNREHHTILYKSMVKGV